MEKNKRIKVIIENSPMTCVYGNLGDFSRYKLLQYLTDTFYQKDLMLNKEFKDQINILVYPSAWDIRIYHLNNGNFCELQEIDKAEYQTGDTLYVPGNYNNKKVYFFPAISCSDMQVKVNENIFVESFPYGKQEFLDFVFEIIAKQGITCENKILLYEGGRKYGATDITAQQEGLDNVYERISKYVSGIFTDMSILDETFSLCIESQYKKKKRIVLDDCKKRFAEGYERDFNYLKQRWMCDEEKSGILTESAFEYISDYKRMEKMKGIEKQIFDNLIQHIDSKKKEIKYMIKNLFFSYLGDLIVLDDSYISDCFTEFIKTIKKKYKFDVEEKCPESPIDFRVICNKNQYVIKMRKHLECMVEINLKDKIKAEICDNLKKCEVKYCE